MKTKNIYKLSFFPCNYFRCINQYNIFKTRNYSNHTISNNSNLDSIIDSGSNSIDSNNWKEYKLQLFSILNDKVLDYLVHSFYRDKYSNINSNVEIINFAIILKIQFIDNTVRSISKVLIINNKTNTKNLIDRLRMYWELRSDYYHLKEIKNVIIYYKKLRSEKIKYSNFSNNNKNKINNYSNVTYETEFRFDGLTLPKTTNLLLWGKLHKQDNTNSLYIESNKKIGDQRLYYNVFANNDYNLIQVFINNTLISTIKDIFIDNNIDNTTFNRIINNNIFNYKCGILINKEINRKMQYIKPVSKSIYRTKDYITLDIETRNINGVLEPVCISIYDGKNTKSFYITDYASELDMIKNAFNSLNSRKYNYQKIYVHNLSYFDGIFLLKYLAILGNIKPLIRNGQIYNIRLEMLSQNKKKHVLYIRDSLLMLPASLSKLSKSFKVKNPKLIFPIHSVNHLPLDYVGSIPPQKYFKSTNDYADFLETISNNKQMGIIKDSFGDNVCVWDLKKELIKYCENDVVSLHQVIDKFSLEIFKLFRLDVCKYMTLSSIAFSIFRSNFMKDQNIPKITGEMFNDIYKSYKGGIVDMYKPQGFNLFFQDINSSYPEAMCNDMPGGKVKYVEGPLDLNDPNNFGFFKAKIVANDKLNIPILPTKYKNTTICPIGTWTDWYFSEELKEAQNNYGYKITLLKGYKFERVNLFTDYVKFLYTYKENTLSDDPKYLIIKFILNMLYGRFGMKPEKEETIIINSDEAEDLYSNSDYSIKDVIDIGSGKEMLSLIKNKDNIDDNDIYSPNISIAIASAVVSYGRIKINRLKHMLGIITYYSDTDCIVTNKPIPDYLIGPKLGQLKIVDKLQIGYFISPKLYGYLNSENNNIVKNKGLKNKLFFYELSFLLYKDAIISKEHEKWYRNWSSGNITIITENFTLIATNNKRQLIYDSYMKLVDTRPYYFENGYIVNDSIGFVLNISSPNFKEKLITPPRT